jgi:hypothetical protein
MAETVPCGQQGIACSRTITVVFGGNTYMIVSLDTVIVNNEAMMVGPSGEVDLGPGVTYSLAGFFSIFYIAGSTKLTIMTDGGTRTFIFLPDDFKNRVEGMCGNFNDDMTDDFTDSTGYDAGGDAQEWGAHWKTDSTCADVDLPTDYDPCEENPLRRSWSNAVCELISKSSIFEECRKHVTNYMDFEDDCRYDAALVTLVVTVSVCVQPWLTL